MAIRRLIKNLTLACVATTALSACALQESDLFTTDFWSSSPFLENTEAELGIADLAKGNFVAAEGHFQKALRANPKDVNALLGAGILYQNTGQLTRSRQMYEAVLALRPGEEQQFVIWNNLNTQSIAQIASVNLSLLDSGQVPSALQVGQGPAGFPTGRAPGNPSLAALPGSTVPGSAASAGPTALGSIGSPQALPGRGAANVASFSQPPALGPSSAGGAIGSVENTLSAFSTAEQNALSRFITIRALRDQGLLTPEEFSQRRRANLGVLVPLTAPPPSAGLERPVPSSEQISGRLRAIGRALELRSISVSQHASERNMILDALMPAAPVRLRGPAVPPNGLLEAADTVRKLEQLRDAGLISSDEYARERGAIEAAMQPTSGTAAAGASGAPKQMSDAKPAMSGPQPAVHLASYRSQKQAEQGWRLIQRRHRALLGELSSGVDQVAIKGKGTYYRLKAGPLKDRSAASKLCGDLKKRRQFCEVSQLGG